MQTATRTAVLFCCLAAASAALFDQVVFLGDGLTPPWWSVSKADVPGLAANASQVEACMSDSAAFSSMVDDWLGCAGGDAIVARTLGYLLNHNLTFGGGCPVPPHAAAFNTLVHSYPQLPRLNFWLVLSRHPCLLSTMHPWIFQVVGT